jgi:hypothetical protein
MAVINVAESHDGRNVLASLHERLNNILAEKKTGVSFSSNVAPKWCLHVRSAAGVEHPLGSGFNLPKYSDATIEKVQHDSLMACAPLKVSNERPEAAISNPNTAVRMFIVMAPDQTASRPAPPDS